MVTQIIQNPNATENSKASQHSWGVKWVLQSWDSDCPMVKTKSNIYRCTHRLQFLCTILYVKKLNVWADCGTCREKGLSHKQTSLDLHVFRLQGGYPHSHPEKTRLPHSRDSNAATALATDRPRHPPDQTLTCQMWVQQGKYVPTGSKLRCHLTAGAQSSDGASQVSTFDVCDFSLVVQGVTEAQFCWQLPGSVAVLRQISAA